MHTLKSDGRKYIGITCQNPLRRWSNGTGYTNNKYFTNTINKYGWDAFKHEILFNGLSKEQAYTKEKALIKLFGTQNSEKGFNLTSGGDGTQSLVISDEARQKMSTAHKGKEYIKISNDALIHQYVDLKKSEADCAKYFKVSRPTIARRLAKIGIQTKIILDISKKELEYQYIVLNKTQKECAEYFNCSVVTIKRFVNKYSIKKDKASIAETIRQTQLMYDISYEELYHYYIVLDKTREQCSKYFNCGNHIIDKYLKRYNIKKNHKGPKCKIDITFDQLYDLRVVQKKTAEECAKIFNCCKATIIRKQKKLGITMEEY